MYLKQKQSAIFLDFIGLSLNGLWKLARTWNSKFRQFFATMLILEVTKFKLQKTSQAFHKSIQQKDHISFTLECIPLSCNGISTI